MHKNKFKKVPFIILSTVGITTSFASIAASNNNGYNANTKKFTDYLPTDINNTVNKYFFKRDTITKFTSLINNTDLFKVDNTFYNFNNAYMRYFNSDLNLRDENNRYFVNYGSQGIKSYYKPDLLNNNNSQVQYLNDFNIGDLSTNDPNALKTFNDQNKFLILSKSDQFPEEVFKTITSREGGAEQFVKVVRVDDGGLNANEQTYRFEFGMQTLRNQSNAWLGNLPNYHNSLMRMNIIWSDDFEPVITKQDGTPQEVKVTWVAQHNNYNWDYKGKKEFTFNLKHHKIDFNSKNDEIGRQGWGLPLFKYYGDSDKAGHIGSTFYAAHWNSNEKLTFGYPKVVNNWHLLDQDIHHVDKNINGLNSNILSAGFQGQFLRNSNVWEDYYNNVTKVAPGVKQLNSLATTFGSALQLSWNAKDIPPWEQSGTNIYITMKFKKKDFWKPSSASRSKDASYIGATNYLVYDANNLSGRDKGGNLAVGNFWVHQRTTNRPLPVKINSYKKNTTNIDFKLPIANYKYYQKQNGNLVEVFGHTTDPHWNTYNATNSYDLNEYEKSGITFHASSIREEHNWGPRDGYAKMLNPKVDNNFVFAAPSDIDTTVTNRKWSIPRTRFSRIGSTVVELDGIDWNRALIAVSKDTKDTYKNNFYNSTDPHIFNGYNFDWNSLFKKMFDLDKHLKDNEKYLENAEVAKFVADANEILKRYATEAKNKSSFIANAVYSTNDGINILNNDTGSYIVVPYKTSNYDRYVTELNNLITAIDNAIQTHFDTLTDNVRALNYIDDTIKTQFVASFNKTNSSSLSDAKHIKDNAVLLNTSADQVYNGKNAVEIGNKQYVAIKFDLPNEMYVTPDMRANYRFATDSSKTNYDRDLTDLRLKFDNNNKLKHNAYVNTPLDIKNVSTTINALNGTLTKVKLRYDALHGLDRLTNLNKAKNLDLFTTALANFYLNEVYNKPTVDEANKLINYLVEFNGDPSTNRDNNSLFKAIKYLKDNTEQTVYNSNNYKYANNKTVYDDLLTSFKTLFERNGNEYKLKLITPSNLQNQTSKDTIDRYMAGNTTSNSIAHAYNSLNGETNLENLRSQIQGLNNFSQGIKDTYKDALTSWDWPRRNKTYLQGATDLTNELKRIDTKANDFRTQVQRYLDVKNSIVYTKASNKNALDAKINQINSKLATAINSLTSINDLKINQLVNEREVTDWASDLKAKIDALDGKLVFVRERQAEIDRLQYFDQGQKTRLKNLITTNSNEADINNYVLKLKAIDTQATNTKAVIDKYNNLVLDSASLSQEDRNNYNNASANNKNALQNAKNTLSTNINDSGVIKNNLISAINSITNTNALDNAKTTLENQTNAVTTAISNLDGNLILRNVMNELTNLIANANTLHSSNELDNSIKAELLTAINTATTNKEAHKNSVRDLNNDIASLTKAISKAKAKQKILEAKILKTQLDNNHLTKESSILMNKINDLDRVLQNTGSNNSTIVLYAEKLDAEIKLQESRLKAKLIKDKMGQGVDNRVSVMINDYPMDNVLRHSITAVDDARSQLDLVYPKVNKDDINNKATALDSSITDARAKLAKEIDSLTNIDATIANAFKTYISNDDNNLTNAINAYNNAVRIDKLFKKIKDNKVLYTETDTNKIDLSPYGSSYKAALAEVEKLIDSNNKGSATNSGFTENVVTNSSTYLTSLENKLSTLSTEYNKLNDLTEIEEAKKKFINDLKEAIEINNLIKDNTNNLTKNIDLDEEISKATNPSVTTAVSVNGNINTKDDVDTSLSVNITNKAQLTELQNLTLANKTTTAANSALTEAITNATNEANKWVNNNEYDNDEHKSSFFNGIKDNLNQAIAKAKQAETNANNLTKVNAAIELDKAISKAKLDTLKAKAKADIAKLNHLSNEAKTQLNNNIDIANENDINNITTKAKDLDNAYKDLADIIKDLKSKTGDNFGSNLFNNSSVEAQNNLKQAFNTLDNSKVQNINDSESLKGISTDLDTVKPLIENLNTTLNALDGEKRLNDLKDQANTKLDKLLKLTNKQREALKDQVSKATTLDQITSNNNVDNPSLNSILDQAIKLNNAMESLRDNLDNIPNDLKDKSSINYINADETSRNEFGKALEKVNNIIDNNYSDLDISKITEAKDNLNTTKDNLNGSAAVALANDALAKLITYAKDLKDSNKLTGDNLTKLSSSITTAEDSKRDNDSNVTELNKAINDLHGALIETKSNEYITEAKKVILELRSLDLTDLADDLQNKVNNVKTALLTANKIDQIDANLEDLYKWTNIDKNKIAAAKVLNKILSNYSNNLNTIVKDLDNNQLINAISDLNTIKDQVNALMNVNNPADEIVDKTTDLETKRTALINELSKAVNTKNNLSTALDKLFKEAINDDSTIENKLQVFNKLNQLDQQTKLIKDDLTKFSNSNNSLNYILSSRNNKNKFIAAKDELTKLYEYTNNNIINTHSNLTTNDLNFNNYLNQLENSRVKLNTAWDSLTGEAKVILVKDNFINALKDAYKTINAIRENNYLNDIKLDASYNANNNPANNNLIKSIASNLDDESKFDSNNINLNITNVSDYNDLILRTNKLKTDAKNAGTKLINEQLAKYNNLLNKFTTGEEFGSNEYNNSDFNTIKDAIKQHISDSNIFKVTNNQGYDLVAKAKELQNALEDINLALLKAKTKLEINNLEHLDNVIKTNFNNIIDSSNDSTLINDQLIKASALNNSYTGIKNVIDRYNNEKANTIKFNNSDLDLQNEVEAKFNNMSNIINDINNVEDAKIISSNLDDINNKVNELTIALDNLNGLAKLQETKDQVIDQIQNLNYLNNAQKESFKQKVIAANYIDDLIGNNRDINHPLANSILDLANKLNNSMQVLNDYVNPNNQNDQANSILDTYKNKTASEYKFASTETQLAFDQALNNATSVLDKTNGNDLTKDQVDTILNELKLAKAKLEESAKTFKDNLIKDLDNRITDSVITDNDVKEKLKNSILDAINNIDKDNSKNEATNLKSKTVEIINKVEFINDKINKLDNTINNNPIFNNDRFKEIAKEILNDIEDVKTDINKIINNWKEGKGSKVNETKEIEAIDLNTEANINTTANTASDANDKLYDLLASINDYNLQAANKVLKSNLVYSYAKNQTLKDLVKDLLPASDLAKLNNLTISNNITKALELIANKDALKAKLNLDTLATDNDIINAINAKLEHNQIYKDIINSVLNTKANTLDTSNINNLVNTIITSNLDNILLAKIATKVNLNVNDNLEQIKQAVIQAINDGNSTTATAEQNKIKEDLIRYLHQPNLIQKLNAKLNQIFNDVSKTYALSLINDTNFNNLTANELNNIKVQLTNAMFDQANNTLMFDYNLEEIIQATRLLDLASKVKSNVANVDSATKDNINKLVDDLYNEVTNETNIKGLIENKVNDLFNITTTKLNNALDNINELNASSNHLINIVNKANETKESIEYINAKDYSNYPNVVDSISKIAFDASLANANSKLNNESNNLLVNTTITKDQLFNNNGLAKDAMVDNPAKELNTLAIDLDAKTKALDGLDILKAAQSIAISNINKLKQLDITLKNKLANDINNAKTNVEVYEIEAKAKDLNKAYLDLNALIVAINSIKNSAKFTKNTTLDDKGNNLKDVINDLIAKTLAPKGLIKFNLGLKDDLAIVKNTYDQLIKMVDIDNNSNGLNGNIVYKNEQDAIIDALFTTAKASDKVTEANLAAIKQDFKTKIHNEFDNGIKNTFNKFIELEHKKATDTTNFAKEDLAKLNDEVNAIYNEIVSIKINVPELLNLARAKSQLKDLINQVNDWLNTNTKDTQVNLRGNLPLVMNDTYNDLINHNSDLDTINNDIEKLNLAFTEANRRYDQLSIVLDKLKDLIQTSKDYLNSIDDTDLTKELNDAIETAKQTLNTDDQATIIKATSDLEDALDHIKLKNQIIEAKKLKDQLNSNDLYNKIINDLTQAINQAQDVVDQVASNAMTNELKNKQKQAIDDLAKAIAKAKLNKTIIDAKQWINSIKDNDKYQDIKNTLNNAIETSLIANDDKTTNEIIQDNNKLINDLDNAKLDKAIIDAKDLLDELNKNPNKYQDLIDQLNNSINNNSNINKDANDLVDQATKSLNKDVIDIKAKAKITDAKEILDLVDKSLLNDDQKQDLTTKINDLINKTNDAINNLSKEEIIDAINDLDQAITEANKEVKKADYENSINLANDLTNDNSSLDDKTKEELVNKVNNIKDQLSKITNPKAIDYEKAKEEVDKAINETIIDATINKIKDYIDTIDNNKYNPIIDKLDNSIKDALDNLDNKTSNQIINNNNKLLNDLANAKLDKTIIDANDLIKKLKDKYPNEINKIKDLVNKVNSLDKSNTKLVEEVTKELVKEIINTKAKASIKDAKDVLKDLSNSLVNPVDKINLSKEIKDLIKQINDSINDEDASETDINNLINQLNKAVDNVKDAIAKADYLDTKQKAKKEINNSNLSNSLKDKFNNLVDNIDKELNKIKRPTAINYAKAKDKINNLVGKIKLEDAILEAIDSKNDLIKNNNFDFLLSNIKDPIIKAINDAINQAIDVLNNHPAKVKDQITKINNKIKEQLNKADKEIKLIKDLIDQTINHISNLPNLEPELIKDLANKAKSLNNEPSLIELKDASSNLNDKHGTLINKFNQANDLIDSDLFAKTNPDKQTNLTDAIEFIKTNSILGKNNKGLTNDHNQINNAIELLERVINDIDGMKSNNKTAWYLIPIALIASIAFWIGAIFTRKKK
ncbi:hypothetical protein GE118_03165 [Mycoplasma sp. NEAQ87857]|uniref:FIVAR domain-containing protein n=1 Tax=Mycoplasma sp. NEAQ87857 TaxID=2683967 RepID=UPI0013195D13|nr:FIVAR domain-containing protein [Mycoplasma sp. NEAQ87857]QGZ97789.1 hypothetical protein GE118_03165 [Mycoplasma sp. NEAQ87857]